MTVGVVLLAAGGSSRLGHPKQLVRYQGTTLVRRAAEAAASLRCGPVVVVLGAARDAVAAELAGLAVRTVDHADWAAGPGGSLRAGLSALREMEPPELAAVLVLLCDQLRVDAAHLRRLLDTFERTRASVVASAYEDTQGVPVLFARDVFPELEALSPGQGARGVIASVPSRVVDVPLPGGGDDVDTPEDVSRLT